VLVLDVFDAEVDRAETASAIETLLTLGKIRYVGVSHHTGWQLAEMRGAGIPVACAVAEYSLLNREAEAELVPAADYAGVALIAGAGLGRGVLTDKYRNATPQDSRLAGELSDYAGAYLDERSNRVLAGVRRPRPLWACRHWTSPWPSTGSTVSRAPLVSPRTPAQLAEVTGSEVELADEIAEVLDQISWGPSD
jgi:aryl-alcohol dehydrogenase-like predicted oxidoreductase